MTNLNFSPEKDLRWFFPTPIVVHHYPDGDRINEELRSIILKTEDEAEPIFRNVIGGWATTKDFLTWDVPCIGELGAYIRENRPTLRWVFQMLEEIERFRLMVDGQLRDLITGLNEVQIKILRLFGERVCHVYQLPSG